MVRSGVSGGRQNDPQASAAAAAAAAAALNCHLAVAAASVASSSSNGVAPPPFEQQPQQHRIPVSLSSSHQIDDPHDFGSTRLGWQQHQLPVTPTGTLNAIEVLFLKRELEKLRETAC